MVGRAAFRLGAEPAAAGARRPDAVRRAREHAAHRGQLSALVVHDWTAARAAVRVDGDALVLRHAEPAFDGAQRLLRTPMVPGLRTYAVRDRGSNGLRRVPVG